MSLGREMELVEIYSREGEKDLSRYLRTREASNTATI